MRCRNLFFSMAVSALLALPASAADHWQWHKVSNLMWDERWAPAYTLLSDGHSALVAGGYSFTGGGCVLTADTFDETTQQFHRCRGHLHIPRDFGIATPLPDGSVLISGGFNDIFGSLNIAEIYHPATETFSIVDKHMLSPRELHTATPLKDGTVLIVGGLDLWKRKTQSTAEIYDPVTMNFRATLGHMTNDRFGHAACLLSDGRVLIVGGTSVLFGKGGYSTVLSSAEIYDPSTRTFRVTGTPMTMGRDRPTASLLPDGTVLIAGGQGPGGASIDYAEVYDPKKDRFTRLPANEQVPRMAHCSCTLPNGSLLFTGGWSAPSDSTTSTVEEFDPNTLQFTMEEPLPFSSHDAAQVVFPDGEVLVAGGKTVSSNGTADGIRSGAWAIPTN
jgi:hypothetical protein